MEREKDIREIELNQLAILSKAKTLELEGKRNMEEHEKILFQKLTEKYPSENFFIFNLQSGFFKGLLKEVGKK
jgi:hypothetical protein